jgi:hypothetical protein
MAAIARKVHAKAKPPTRIWVLFERTRHGAELYAFDHLRDAKEELARENESFLGDYTLHAYVLADSTGALTPAKPRKAKKLR